MDPRTLPISPMYSNMKDRALSTPFCTFSSGTRYSFMSAGSTAGVADTRSQVRTCEPNTSEDAS